MIAVSQLTKSFGSTSVLKGVDLTQAAGTVTALIGPSGCGKSTFLRCINRLETPDGGTIHLEGEKVTSDPGESTRADEARRQRARSRTGMVFQSFNLFPHLTVLENILEAPLRVQHRARAEVESEAIQLLRKVGLENRHDFYPSALSGGQQQRVAIARALATKPVLLLMDEPTSALDPEMREEVLRVIRALSDEGMTMMIVTHEMELARMAADEVIFFDGGRIAESGPSDAFFNAPRLDRTRDFLRSLGSR